MQRNVGILGDPATKRPIKLEVIVRPSTSVPARYRCHLVTPENAEGKRAQVADIRLDLN